MKQVLPLALALLAWSAAVQAQEYEVLAERMEGSGENFVFEGSVSIDSADLRLRAARLEVDGTKYRASGSPAELEVDADDAGASVRAAEIAYDAAAGELLMPAGGELRREGFSATAGGLRFDVRASELRASLTVAISAGAMQAEGTAARATLAARGLELRLEGAPARLTVPQDGSDQAISARAARIEYAERDGVAQALLLEGAPVELSYPDQQSGTMLVASAERIEYDQASGIITMRGGAQAQRGNESIVGESITFDTASSDLVADAEEGGRVKAVITLPQ